MFTFINFEDSIVIVHLDLIVICDILFVCVCFKFIQQ